MLGECPLACVVLHGEADATLEALREFLTAEQEFPQWWLPDDIEFVDEIPKTATGKFDKKALREAFRDRGLRWTAMNE